MWPLLNCPHLGLVASCSAVRKRYAVRASISRRRMPSGATKARISLILVCQEKQDRTARGIVNYN